MFYFHPSLLNYAFFHLFFLFSSSSSFPSPVLCALLPPSSSSLFLALTYCTYRSFRRMVTKTVVTILLASCQLHSESCCFTLDWNLDWAKSMCALLFLPPSVIFPPTLLGGVCLQRPLCCCLFRFVCGCVRSTKSQRGLVDRVFVLVIPSSCIVVNCWQLKLLPCFHFMLFCEQQQFILFFIIILLTKTNTTTQWWLLYFRVCDGTACSSNSERFGVGLQH